MTPRADGEARPAAGPQWLLVLPLIELNIKFRLDVFVGKRTLRTI